MITDNDWYFPEYDDNMTDSLSHYGVSVVDGAPGRGSGRYPRGSGDEAYQRAKNFQDHVRELQRSGLKLKDIASQMDMSIEKLKAKMSIASSDMYRANTMAARKLKEKGWSTAAISRKLGIPASTINGYFSEEKNARRDQAMTTAEMLKKEIDENKYISIGKGVEVNLGISETRKKVAMEILREMGYESYNLKVRQQGKNRNGQRQSTTVQVMAKSGTDLAEIYNNIANIKIPGEDLYTPDHGDTWRKIEPPIQIPESRIFIKYTDENGRGGVDKDGVIELRRGVEDLDLGKAQYAQVRIGVEGNRYMKGMAVYSDDIPDGYDIVYNTNKTRDQYEKVFKQMKDDPTNPFGAEIRTDDDPNSEKRNLIRAQRHYIGADGEEHQSALNIVNEEGNWESWGRTLSSQFLSKQRPFLAQRQLDVTYDRKLDDFNEIMELTNPTVKRQMLYEFAESCDSAAVHLKAAAIPGSASHVILPVASLAPNEVFAPGYEDGSTVVLVRYPFGGNFEAAELKVNNHNPEARAMIGLDSPDAIGIHHDVAAKLSGADFDGDTVTVIPNDSGDIVTEATPKALQGYEPKVLYRKTKDMPKTGIAPEGKDPADYDGFDTQKEMGQISNLITDMQIMKAPPEEIYRAVRHSMTVIDAEKHNLDWKTSYEENGIAELKRKYQGGVRAGASTLISMAKGRKDILERKNGVWVKGENGEKGHVEYVDKDTGEKKYQLTGRMIEKYKLRDPDTGKMVEVKPKFDPATREKYYVGIGRNKKRYSNIDESQIVVTKKQATQRSTKMQIALDEGDAHKLSSGTVIEDIYANHANRLRALANRARKEWINTPELEYNPSARKIYYNEYKSLDTKLKIAKSNRPYEAKANILARSLFNMKLAADPRLEFDEDKKRKERSRCLEYARKAVGAKKIPVTFTDREWAAIQSGAITSSFLKELMRNCDKDELKRRSMPKQWNSMSSAKVSRARQMLKNGSTILETAQALGVSKSTLDKALYSDDYSDESLGD